MPNIIDQNGITTQSVQEIITEILDGAPEFPGMREIYGADINVEPNSPDGQMVNIVAQGKADVLDMIVQIYNSFDPDKAIGIALDARAAINGVTRLPGSYTQQNITVTVDRALSLAGQNLDPVNAFTIQDATGNQYQLVNGYSFGAAGSTSLLFQATKIGSISSALNSINIPITIQLGVVSVNNPSGPTLVGANEESDFALRLRRAQLVSLPGTGYLTNLYSALYAVVGLTEVKIYENTTNTTDVNGVPGHSIWVIASGGTNADVGFAIYRKRSAGCGMKGSVVVPITQVDGTIFDVLFDRPTDEDLYISFDVVAITGSIDVAYIRTQIATLLRYNINQSADTASIVALIKSIAPNASVSDEGVSDDDITYVNLLAPSAVQNRFAVSSARIKINGSF